MFSIADCSQSLYPFVFCNSEIWLLQCVLYSTYIEYYTGSMVKSLQERGKFSRRATPWMLIIIHMITHAKAPSSHGTIFQNKGLLVSAVNGRERFGENVYI